MGRRMTSEGYAAITAEIAFLWEEERPRIVEEVYEAAMKGIEAGVTFKEALLDNAAISGALTEAELDALLDPTTYVGASPDIVDTAIAAIRKEGRIG